MNFEEDNWDDLKLFFQNNYHSQYILLDKEFFDYFFKNYKSQGYSLKNIILDGKIVAILGLIPISFQFKDKIISANFLINLIADNGYRGYGLGPRLILENQKEVDLQLNTGYNNNVKPLHQKLGWTEMPPLRRFIKIISSKKVEELAQKKLLPTDFTSRKLLKTENQGFTFSKINSIDKRLTQFWEKIRNKYPLTVRRDQDYLKWRYLNHPKFNYDIFVVEKDRDICSYIIARIENNNEFRVVRIVDFISQDESEIYTLQKLVKHYQDLDVDLIDFFFTGNFHVQSLELIGFKEANISPYSEIPLLFNPINRDKKFITFAYKINNKNLNSSDIENNEWYITKGDGDQDRPN